MIFRKQSQAYSIPSHSVVCPGNRAHFNYLKMNFKKTVLKSSLTIMMVFWNAKTELTITKKHNDKF